MTKRQAFLCMTALLGVLLLGSSSARAQTAVDKLGRGLAGMTCGVLEFPGNIYRETNRSGAAGIPLGFAKGLGMIVARELVGVYEFVTAPLPFPDNYRPILEPEYPWGYFQGEPAPRKRR